MLHTLLVWSLPNGRTGKKMLLLVTMASQAIASNFPANSAACWGFGQGRQRLR
jgi:hypothetical protein